MSSTRAEAESGKSKRYSSPALHDLASQTKRLLAASETLACKRQGQARKAQQSTSGTMMKRKTRLCTKSCCQPAPCSMACEVQAKILQFLICVALLPDEGPQKGGIYSMVLRSATFRCSHACCSCSLLE